MRTASPSTSVRRLIAGLTLGAAAMSSAFAAGYAKGPAPTVASIEAAGPFATAKATLVNASAYGNGTTVYHPTDRSQGTFGLVVLCPGFVSSAGLYAGIAERIASHGFVVAVVQTKSLLDMPKARATQLVAVMDAMKAQNKVQAVAWAGQVDETRVAFMGHSAGGAGTFYAAATHPELKALVGLMAGEPGTSYKSLATTTKTPTLVLTAQNDGLASSWSKPFFQALDGSTPAVWVELAGFNHLSLWTTASASSQAHVAKYALAWAKRFVDEDERYGTFFRAQGTDLSNFGSKGSF
ncbi:MAG: hypothetical protein RI907_2404 [Pseudomonadota bacterium]|jgi:dienelactone hydrolase